jgi:hypothetical protein
MAAGNPRRVVIALTGCLVLFAAWAAIWPVARAFTNVEIDVNEGWNAYHADAALGRAPLYPSPDELVTNNYPPLSFYLVGGLSRATGDPVLTGRLLSLVAVAVITACVVVIVRHLGGSRTAAGVAAAYYLATMCRFFSDYVGMNDPHLFAQAVMTVGFVGFLRSADRGRGVVLPVLVMVAAGFVKHNLVVLPAAALVRLGVQSPRRVVLPGLAAAAAIIAGFAACSAAYGNDFFFNMTSPRGLHWRHGLGAVGTLQWVAVGLVAWAPVAWFERHDPRVRFVTLLVGFALGSFLLQKCGDGVANNAQFELLFAVAIGLGLAYDRGPGLPVWRRYSPAAFHTALLALVCLRLAIATHYEPVRVLFDPAFRVEVAERERAMAATAERIRATPGDVAGCSLACYRSGKRFAADPFNVHQRVLAGRLTQEEIDRLITTGRITIVPEDPLVRWSTEWTGPVPVTTSPRVVASLPR